MKLEDRLLRGGLGNLRGHHGALRPWECSLSGVVVTNWVCPFGKILSCCVRVFGKGMEAKVLSTLNIRPTAKLHLQRLSLTRLTSHTGMAWHFSRAMDPWTFTSKDFHGPAKMGLGFLRGPLLPVTSHEANGRKLRGRCQGSNSRPKYELFLLSCIAS